MLFYTNACTIYQQSITLGRNTVKSFKNNFANFKQIQHRNVTLAITRKWFFEKWKKFFRPAFFGKSVEYKRVWAPKRDFSWSGWGLCIPGAFVRGFSSSMHSAAAAAERPRIHYVSGHVFCCCCCPPPTDNLNWNKINTCHSNWCTENFFQASHGVRLRLGHVWPPHGGVCDPGDGFGGAVGQHHFDLRPEEEGDSAEKKFRPNPDCSSSLRYHLHSFFRSNVLLEVRFTNWFYNLIYCHTNQSYKKQHTRTKEENNWVTE